MPAVEVWFADGPVDGRITPIETNEAGELPTSVVLPQSGAYIGVSDHPTPPVRHWYVRGEDVNDLPVFRYAGILDDGRGR
jgi:hypothetical protein